MISVRITVAIINLLITTYCTSFLIEKEIPNRKISNSFPITIALLWYIRSNVPVRETSPIRGPMQSNKYSSLSWSVQALKANAYCWKRLFEISNYIHGNNFVFKELSSSFLD